jgi:hypothetical protein
MRLDRVINLLVLEETINANGFRLALVKSRRTVFAKKGSVRSTEFYQAAQSGFSLELMFEVLKLEYRSEKYIEFQSKIYKIIRTYEKDKMVELACQAYDESPVRT